MTEKTKKATAEKGRGQVFDTPVEYDWKWLAYENTQEMVAAQDTMSLEQQMKQRNRERENNARTKALNAKLDALGIVEQTAANNEQVRLRDMFDLLMLTKLYTEEQARDLASANLKIEWKDED